ncbi:WxcM-like domain-containing protein [Flavobacterium caseinilyticum]|uniref:Sugar epimerase n=1 Tax=Flavobacterium caseinilyticum TaxID=2541732 RepID=A0A4R5AV95_9FLAO|nr:WxcM-like domain-containing protein [Flavobacterium caseinilyticum]TDD77011.1 sugar epimerase [Flavobacterium caseinilyticum]
MIPNIIKGGRHADSRGTLFYNNNFVASAIKRMYIIENNSTDFVRAWQGHKIEQRWFSALKGSFTIRLIAVDNWESPTKKLEQFSFTINAEKLDVLHVPSGYISSIQSLEEGSKLLSMSDYLSGELQDEYRYEFDYFK